MAKKRNVLLVQVNNTYGRGAFLPYSVGLLRAYAETLPSVLENYHFLPFLYLREPIVNVVDRLSEVHMVGISCYIWNFNYSMALARELKKKFPYCLIVLGGPHVPNESKDFFRQHPYCDVLVHGEGEETFAHILIQQADEGGGLLEIPGLSVNGNLETIKTLPAGRITDLDRIPSPYLSGLFEDLPWGRYDFQPTSETHRGCPFSCSFCDWGSSVFTKVRKFSDERISRELEWFAQKRCSLLYNADANFAMYERDVDYVRQMTELKARTGYPERFRAAYAKNSGDRVFRVAELLHQAGMNKGVTLSFQSMDETTLKNVKRSNIKLDNFKELIQKYRREGIATYTELIVGLPGETYDSFADGVNTLLEAGVHEGLNCYTCELLPNSEMSQPAYRQRHGIQSVTVPVLFYHGTPQEDPHREEYEIVVETDTLSREDWLRTQMFAWVVQAFHCLGLTRVPATYMHARYGWSYRKFYEELLAWMQGALGDTVASKAYYAAYFFYHKWQQGITGQFLGRRFGNILWPPEEAGFLICASAADQFYQELRNWFMRQGGRPDVIAAQKALARLPGQQQEEVFRWCGQWFHVIRDKTYTDLEEYAREVVWWGRKGGSFLHKNVRLVEEVAK